MTIIEALKLGAQQLDQVKILSAILDAEVLLSDIIKKPKEFIFANPKIKITKKQENLYKKIIKRRARFEPVAYITGYKEFFNLDLLINKNVLIPRPETELLIEEVIKFAKNAKTPKATSRNVAFKIKILDVGTGSGAIAIALKKNLPDTEVTASDISKSALKVAQKNIRLNKVDVKLIHSNLLNKFKNGRFDIIVANLPYVPDKNKKLKNPFAKPLKFEPAKALYAGRYGLDAYEKLFKQIAKLKNKPTALFCEIGDEYLDKTIALAKKTFPKWQLEIKQDLCGKNRLLILKTASWS